MDVKLPEAKPRTSTANPSDLIIQVNTTCQHCGKQTVRHIPILVDPVMKFERDEMGMIVKDAQGNPKPKIRISYEYDHLPSIHPAYDPAREEEFRILYERHEEERILAQKVKKPKKTLAEVTA